MLIVIVKKWSGYLEEVQYVFRVLLVQVNQSLSLKKALKPMKRVNIQSETVH